MSSPQSPHWRTNHEYQPFQLARFHVVNLHHQANNLTFQTHTFPSLNSLRPAIEALRATYTLDSEGFLSSHSTDPATYDRAISLLQSARRDLPDIQNVNAKALIRRTLVNSIYSCIAIRSILADINKPEA